MLTRDEAELNYRAHDGSLRTYKGPNTNLLTFDGYEWWVKSKKSENWFVCSGVPEKGLETVGSVIEKKLYKGAADELVNERRAAIIMTIVVVTIIIISTIVWWYNG